MGLSLLILFHLFWLYDGLGFSTDLNTSQLFLEMLVGLALEKVSHGQLFWDALHILLLPETMCSGLSEASVNCLKAQ